MKELHRHHLDSWSGAPSSLCTEGQEMVKLLNSGQEDLPEFSLCRRKGVMFTGEWPGFELAAYWTE